jgi:hypothetical protein
MPPINDWMLQGRKNLKIYKEKNTLIKTILEPKP